MVTLHLTEDEAELVILALDTYRRDHLHDYDDESRPQIAKEITAVARRLRDA